MIIQAYTAEATHSGAQIGDNEPCCITCENCGKYYEFMPTDDVMTYCLQDDVYSEPERICCSEACCRELATKENISIEE